MDDEVDFKIDNDDEADLFGGKISDTEPDHDTQQVGALAEKKSEDHNIKQRLDDLFGDDLDDLPQNAEDLKKCKSLF
jgi:hypothetical protein